MTDVTDITGMTGEEFFGQMNQISDFIFGMFAKAWAVISSNWLLMLSFTITIVYVVVVIFQRVKHIK